MNEDFFTEALSGQQAVVMKAIEKIKPKALDIFNKYREGIKDFDGFGHECKSLLDDVMNLSIKDFV